VIGRIFTHIKTKKRMRLEKLHGRVGTFVYVDKKGNDIEEWSGFNQAMVKSKAVCYMENVQLDNEPRMVTIEISFV
jgi:hypothetical protein